MNEHVIKDEYNTNEILNIMKEKNIFVKGSLPGVGKTTACKNNEKVFFVSPYNKLCQELKKDGVDAITLNKLLAIGVDDNDQIIKMKKYDVSPYKTIVFNEILLYNPRQLYLIKMFMDNNDKRFHCTGDIDQRKPFTFNCNNIENKNDYQLFCLNQIFQIRLH